MCLPTILPCGNERKAHLAKRPNVFHAHFNTSVWRPHAGVGIQISESWMFCVASVTAPTINCKTFALTNWLLDRAYQHEPYQFECPNLLNIVPTVL